MGERCETAIGRAGRTRRVTTAYSADRAASHRKRCRFFAPSPPTAAPARLRLALAPLRTPPHSVWRAAAVRRVGRSQTVPTTYIVHMGLFASKTLPFYIAVAPDGRARAFTDSPSTP